MEKAFICSSAEETIMFGKKVGMLLKPGMVVLLEGMLSAGKTTFVKGIGLALGINKVINSPTYTIMKTYDDKLFHLDLYRITSISQDFDLEEYINGDGITVIEWPFNGTGLLPKAYLLVKITILDAEKRLIQVISNDKLYDKIVGELCIS